MHKAISVWLIVEDGKNKGKIVFQRRSEKDSFSYVYQPAWSGKIEPDESVNDAVLRECKEELGEKFFNKFDFLKIRIFKTDSFDEKGEPWEVSNYLGTVSEKLLGLAKIHNEAFPNFTFLDKSEAFYAVESGKDPKSNIVLFNDQYKVLKQILNGD